MTSTLSPELTRIMLKVRKLQRLAENAGTPEEAAAAAAKVAELMERHAIDSASFENLGDPDANKGYGNESVATASTAWRVTLLFEVARDHRCRAVYFPGQGKMDVIGHRDDIEVVKTMWSWLCGQVEEHLKTTWRAEGRAECEVHRLYSFTGRDTYDYGWTPAEWKKHYRAGATEALTRRISDARRERMAKRTAADSTALMVIDDKVLTLFRQLHPRTGTRRTSRQTGNGYAFGQRDGRSMSLASGGNIAAARRRLTG